MILVVEAGGTKSNLALVNEKGIHSSYTENGLQLSRESLDDLERKVQRWFELSPGLLDAVWVFAAGASANEKTKKFQAIISKALQCDRVYVESDLLAACYATAGNVAGIVGILGTGSNSCYFNGSSIEYSVPPGGFILGDEGSGAHIGKIFLQDFLRNQIPESIRKAANESIGMNNSTILEQLYGNTIKDAAYYCSISGGFVIDNLKNDYCHNICVKSIAEYMDIIESNYIQHSNKLYLVGSVAHLLNEIIETEASKQNINLIKNIQHPINELSIFLSQKEYS